MQKEEEEYAKCKIKLNLDKFWLICGFKDQCLAFQNKDQFFVVLKIVHDLITGSVFLSHFGQTNPSIHFAILLVNWFQNIYKVGGRHKLRPKWQRKQFSLKIIQERPNKQIPELLVNLQQFVV